MNQDSVFWQLYFAIVGRQGGTTNLRHIMQPLFAADTGDAETVLFYDDCNGNPNEAEIVEDGVVSAGLYPPPCPAPVTVSEPAPEVSQVEPQPTDPVTAP